MFRDQSGGAQALTLHEMHIGMGHATRGQFAQRLMIVENWRKIGFARADALAFFAQVKSAGARHHVAGWERFEDMEHFFGVLLVLQQLVQMAPCLQRALLEQRAIWMEQQSTVARPFRRAYQWLEWRVPVSWFHPY